MDMSGIPSSAFTITPSDTTKISAAGLFIGGAGTVTVEPEAQPGTTVQFTAPAGGEIKLRVTKVMATGTSATLIRGYN